MTVGEDVLLAVLSARLTPLQADIFVDRMFFCPSQRDLAAAYGVSSQRVGHVLFRAREKLDALACEPVAA